VPRKWHAVWQSKPLPTALKNTDNLPEQQVVWICGGTMMK